jgi:Polyketide cyclase / dehydrase and lipid transport
VATATFTVSAEDVWRYRLDFANLPEYNPDVSEVERLRDGEPDGDGGLLGPGARFAFQLADPRRPGATQPVELWAVAVEKPTLVAAGMLGGSEAYEEFVVRPLEDGGCEAVLTLWVTLPEGLPDDVVRAAAAGSFDQIDKELRLMKENLEHRSG